MRNRSAACFVVALLACAMVAPEVVVASTPPESTVPPVVVSGEFAADRVIVGFETGVTAVERVQTMSPDVAADHDDLTAVGADTVTTLVELPEGVSVEEAIAEYQSDPNVAYVEPDYARHSTQTSNDPLYAGDYLWGMEGDATSPADEFGSGAAEAWAAGYTGSNNVYVGILDEGIQVDHPDLAANIWTNPLDPVDGIDNDGNGYIDDAHGWDFSTHDNSVFDGANDPYIDAHGTHVAGTIGAVGGNGAGVAGVNWQVRMISAKFLGPEIGWVSDEIEAIDYLIALRNRGVNIVAINASFGDAQFSQAELDAVNRAGDSGMVFVVAAGNEATNNDAIPRYPANYQCTNGGTRGWDCVVSVAAIDPEGHFADFSNTGLTSVDLAAPGVFITSTVPGGAYETWSGTSMAAPHVTGALALCASVDPTLSAADLLQRLFASVATTKLSWGEVWYGRLDIGSMIPMCVPATGGPVTGQVGNLSAEFTSDTGVALTWADALVDESWVEVQWALWYGAAGCGSYSRQALTVRNATSYSFVGLQPRTDYCFRVRGAKGVTNTTYTPWSNAVTANSFRVVNPVLPWANYGSDYQVSIQVAGGYEGYPRVELVSGQLPPGFERSGALIWGRPAKDMIGKAWSFTLKFTDVRSGWTVTKTFNISVVPARPGKFRKLGPHLKTNMSRRRVTLRWSASKGVTAYEYCFDTINDKQCNTSWVRTTRRYAVIGGLSPKTTYYWQVRAVNAWGETAPHDYGWFKFTTGR